MDVNFLLICRCDHRKELNMQKEFYKNYDELPIMLSVNQVAKALGISRTSSYELVRSKGFPAITIGSRIVVPKEEFISWIKDQIKWSEDKKWEKTFLQLIITFSIWSLTVMNFKFTAISFRVQARVACAGPATIR